LNLYDEIDEIDEHEVHLEHDDFDEMGDDEVVDDNDEYYILYMKHLHHFEVRYILDEIIEHDELLEFDGDEVE